MTSPEIEAEIVRLYFAEHWRVGTIAAQLGVHADVVRRVLCIGKAAPAGLPRARLVDPYRDFITDTLARYPSLRSTRLHDMLRERGYKGAQRTLRQYVAEVRPQPRREVYLRTETLPGEQAQIDWAYVGKRAVPGGERALWLFVLVLSHSRALWGEFVFDLSVHSLCRSLQRAARALGGVTRQWLFDNAKTVVIERQGDAVRFHPTLLDLCARMRAQPRLCAVRKANQKERSKGRSVISAIDSLPAARSSESPTEMHSSLASSPRFRSRARTRSWLRAPSPTCSQRSVRACSHYPTRCRTPTWSCLPTSIARRSSASTRIDIRSRRNMPTGRLRWPPTT